MWRSAVIVLAIVLPMGAFAVLREPSHSPLAEFEVAPVSRGRIEETVTALGKLQPRRYVDIGAQVSGQLVHLLVQPGQEVKAGDLLAEIDARLQSAKVEAGRAQIDSLKAQLTDADALAEFAEGEFRRQARLMNEKATREDTFAMARRDRISTAARAESIRAQIRQAEFVLRADEAQLGYTRIFAPMSGTVVSVDAREGQTINATYATPVLMRIADLATLTVWTQVSEADVTRLRPGMPLYFTTLGHGDRRWTGTLRQILPAPINPPTANGTAEGARPASHAPTAAGNVVLYVALFDVPNPSRALRLDMSAQVFFVIGAADDDVTVPMSALDPVDAADGRHSVRVVAGDSVETRSVRIGLHDRFSAQVLNGLSEGEKVVTGRRRDAGRPPLIGVRL